MTNITLPKQTALPEDKNKNILFDETSPWGGVFWILAIIAITGAIMYFQVAYAQVPTLY